MVTRCLAPGHRRLVVHALLGAFLAVTATSTGAQTARGLPVRNPSAPRATLSLVPQTPQPREATRRSGRTRNADDPSTASRAGTRTPQTRGAVQCEKCHADRQFLAGKAKGTRGDSVLFVPDTLLRDSRHRGLVCADCHAGYNDGYPHAAVPAVSRGCQECHDNQNAAYRRSSHARNFADQGKAPTCASCHSSHRVLGADDPRSPTYPLNVARLCGSCHDKKEILDAYFDAPADSTARSAIKDFRRSAHGLAMTQSGLTVSATCSDCHDAHRVLPHDSTESTLNRGNVKATCGACHAGLLAVFDSSAHGVALASGDTTATGQVAPVCVECHGAHKVVDTKDPAWFGGMVGECASCHKRLSETYNTTYHGKASALGDGLAAKCSDCHTAHAMLAADNPNSSVHPSNLVATCETCHAGANANFVMYKPHGDPHDRERNPELYWVWIAMTSLLVGVFSFFGLHSLLWFGRLLAVRKEHPSTPATTAAPTYTPSASADRASDSEPTPKETPDAPLALVHTPSAPMPEPPASATSAETANNSGPTAPPTSSTPDTPPPTPPVEPPAPDPPGEADARGTPS